MEGSTTRRLVGAGLVVSAAAIVTAVLFTVRLLPAADLASAGVAWIELVMFGALAGTAALTAVASLVAGLQHGRLAALLGWGAAASVAGGAVAAMIGSAGLVVALPVAAFLLGGAALTLRSGVLVEGRRARLGIGIALLAIAEAAALAGVLPATTDLVAPLRVPLLGGAALVALGTAPAAGRLAPAALLGAIGATGLLLDRGDGLEVLIGAAALVGAHLAGLRAASEGPGNKMEPEIANDLPDLAAYLSDAVLSFDGRLQLADWNAAAAGLLGLDAASRGARLEDLVGVDIAGLPAVDGAIAVTAGAGGLAIALHRSGAGVIAVIENDRTDDDADRLARELRGTLEELLRARRTIDLQREELERSATVDLLTGVGSRAATLDRLRLEVAQARRYQHPVAVLLVDIDGFAEINRRHGVTGGDALLREIALRMRLRVREADALGRAGSDGFLAVLPHTDEEGAATFAGALRRRIVQRPVLLDETMLTITVSIGVAVMRPGEALDLDGLLARAAEALDSARRGGGDRIALDRDHGFIRLGIDHPAGKPDEGREAT